jgi:hypothetical protein
MPQQEWQCPFCSSISARPQGLPIHIRSRHAKQYPKWSKNPLRIQEALRSSTQEMSDQAPEPPVVSEPAAAVLAQASQKTDNQSAIDLLNQAHVQLRARKQAIEAELARLNDLNLEIGLVRRNRG